MTPAAASALAALFPGGLLYVTATVLAIAAAFAGGAWWARRAAPRAPTPTRAVAAAPRSPRRPVVTPFERGDDVDDPGPTDPAFPGRVAHELRTPLNSVIGFAGVLLKNPGHNLSSQQMLYLGRIRDNGVHLLALIDHLLASAERTAPRPPDRTPVAVGALVRGTVRELAGEAAEERITLETEIPADVSPITTTDAHRFELAFRSLVRGALPLAEEGRMTVRVAATAGRPERIDIAVDGPAVSRERGRNTPPNGIPTEVALATSLYHLLGYPVTTERRTPDTATFSVVLDRE